MQPRPANDPHPILPAVLLLALLLLPASSAYAQRQPAAPKNTGSPTSLMVDDLTGPLSPAELAAALAGEGITVFNAQFTGAEEAAGIFSDGGPILGIEGGVLLSSGLAINVIGPNEVDNVTGEFGLPGDLALTALAGQPTFDAAALAFDFVPQGESVVFAYVFASDEYNEFANTSFSDVVALYVNGNNCATVEGDAVSVNAINNGNPQGDPAPSHPDLFRNNDLDDGGGTIDTEMDGLTVVLECQAAVAAQQTNQFRLVIADAGDALLDSAVFVEAGRSPGDEPTAVSLTRFAGKVAFLPPAGAALLLLLGLILVLPLVARHARLPRR